MPADFVSRGRDDRLEQVSGLGEICPAGCQQRHIGRQANDGKVAGIVSERDIVREISRAGAGVLKEPVERCMTKSVVTCRESDTIDRLMAEMTAHRFRHMPVVERGRLIGLVSIGDVVRMRIAEAEMEAAAMRQYIATG